jgi:hypothetical protein
MANAEIARLRDRLNIAVLVLPGQWFGLMALFWMRFVPALRPFTFDTPPPRLTTFCVCLALSFVPLVLPRAWFRPRAFERGPWYRLMGVHLFRRVAPDGDFVNSRLRRVEPSYRAIATRRELREHLEGTYANERAHLVLFLLGAWTQLFALTTGQFVWAALLTVGNVAFNLYPVLHQRSKRARARRAMRLPANA